MKNPFSLNFLFKSKKEGEKEETFIKVCPKCLSPRLDTLKEFTSGWLTAPKYVCDNCNYSGQVYLEIDVKMIEEHSPSELKEMYYKELSEESFKEEN